MEDLVPVVTFGVAGRVVSIRYPPDGHGGTERLLGGFVAGPFPLQSGTTFHSSHPRIPPFPRSSPTAPEVGCWGRRIRDGGGMQGHTRGPLPPPPILQIASLPNAFSMHCTTTAPPHLHRLCIVLLFDVWMFSAPFLARLGFAFFLPSPPPSPPPTVTLLSGYTAIFSHLIPFSNHWVTAVGELSLSVVCLPQPPGLPVSSQGIAPQPKRADPYETIEPFHAPDPSKQTDETLSACAWILPVTWVAAEGQHWPLSIAVTLSIPTVSRPDHDTVRSHDRAPDNSASLASLPRGDTTIHSQWSAYYHFRRRRNPSRVITTQLARTGVRTHCTASRTHRSAHST